MKHLNITRLVVLSSLIFLVALAWNAMVHLVLLREANAALEALVRPAAERSLVLSLAQTACLSFLFVLTYALRTPHRGVRAGLLHGVLFGLVAGLLVDLNQFILYPIPGSLAFTWFVFGLVEFSAYGAIVGRLYKDEPAA